MRHTDRYAGLLKIDVCREISDIYGLVFRPLITTVPVYSFRVDN
jgi:hypothetical protein